MLLMMPKIMRWRDWGYLNSELRNLESYQNKSK